MKHPYANIPMPLRIGAFNVPDHFNDTSQRAVLSAFAEVAELEPHLLGDIVRLSPARYASFLTYRKDGCLDIHRDGDDPLFDTAEHNVLLIDKSFERYQAAFALVDAQGPGLPEMLKFPDADDPNATWDR